MRETLLFLLTYKDIPVNLHHLLVPKKISIRPKKISTRYSQDVHQQKIEALKKSYIKCIRERKMSFIEAANSVLEDLEDTELIRFYFKIDCLTNDQIKKLCDCSEDKEQIFEIDDNALYQHNLSVLESFVHDRPYIPDSTDKLAAFDEACNSLLSSVGDTTFCISEDSIVDFNVDIARKCLSEALLCFAEKTGKECNAEHLIVYAGLKNWIGDYSPTTPFSYPLLQFYLKHLF